MARSRPVFPRCPGLAVFCLLAALSGLALAACGGEEFVLPTFEDFDRNECDGVPECVSVTTARPLSLSGPAGEIVTLRCPDERPYFWDWGYASTGGLQFALLSTLDRPGEEKRDGITVLVTRTRNRTPAPRYSLHCACSQAPLTGENMTEILQGAAGDEASEPPLSYVEAERTPLYDTDSEQPVAGLSYVGTHVWKALAGEEPPGAAFEEDVQDPSRYRGITWNYSTTNLFDAETFILQTPRDTWGATATEPCFTSGTGGPDSTRTCNEDFRLQECSTDTDCSGFPGTACERVDATVTAPGLLPLSFCARPQDVLWNQVYQTIVKARQIVDITTLNQADQAPDGRFRAAIRNALTYLASTGREVTVRILIGHFTCQDTMPGKIQDLLDDVLRDARTVAGNRLQVQAGYYEANPACSIAHPVDFVNALLYMSMNHSKIVCADGQHALVGGQNMYDEDYLSRFPARDMTLRVQGPAAYDTHAFATHLWGWVRDHMDRTAQVYAWTWKHGEDAYHKDAESLCLERLPPSQRNQNAGNTAVFGVGRLGQWYFQNGNLLTANASDLAINAMLRSARSRIAISQQDVIWGPAAALEGKFGGVLDPPYRHLVRITWWNQAYLDSLAEQLLNGVHVYVAFSNLWSRTGVEGKGAYYNGIEPETVGDWIHWVLSRKDRFAHLPRDQQIEILCKRLHVATLRFGPDAHWNEKHAYADEWKGFANHAKTVIIDGQAFYVGSHNFYPMNLQEYGLIVDDAGLADRYLRTYWQPLWSWSRKSAVCGGEEGSPCMFR